MNVSAINSSTAYTPSNTGRSAVSTGTRDPLVDGIPSPPPLPTYATFAREKASFAEDIARLFREAGIQVPPNPVLIGDFQGYVRVSNNHPDKGKIEQLFRENPNLRDRFTKISSDVCLLRAGENYQEYADEYDRLMKKGELAAVKALVEARIARNNIPFRMAITAQGVETFF